MPTFLSVNKNSGRIVAEYSFRTLDQVDPIIWSRRADIVLQHDRSSSCRLDYAGVVVASLIDLFPLQIACGHMVFTIALQSKMSRTHRYNVIEPIAPVDVHVHCHRTKTMSGIEVAITECVMTSTPQTFVFVFK